MKAWVEAARRSKRLQRREELRTILLFKQKKFDCCFLRQRSFNAPRLYVVALVTEQTHILVIGKEGVVFKPNTHKQPSA